jgi:hypothetical protein
MIIIFISLLERSIPPSTRPYLSTTCGIACFRKCVGAHCHEHDVLTRTYGSANVDRTFSYWAY